MTQCANTCCPEPVDVTVNDTTNNIDSVTLEMTLDVDSPTQQTMNVQAVDADGANVTGYFMIRWWLEDAGYTTPTGAPTPAPFDSPMVSAADEITDSNGKLEIQFNHAGSDVKQFYCSIFGAVFGPEEVSFA